MSKKKRKNTKKKIPVVIPHQHGGYREGSGRKKMKRPIKSMSFYFFRDQLEMVKGLAKQNGKPDAVVVRDCMDKGLGMGKYSGEYKSISERRVGLK